MALALFLATALYYAVRSRDVRVTDRSPSWTWVAMTVGICVGGVVAESLDDAIAFSYVIGGLLSAVPLLVWGQHLRTSS